MSFMERARALYQRDDLVRAAFVLAEGIKREPLREDALNWFLQLYVEELESPGLEQELARVLETQPDGTALYEAIQTELKRRQQLHRLAALNRVHVLRRRVEAVRSELAGEEMPALTQAPAPTDATEAVQLTDDDDEALAILERARSSRRPARRRCVEPAHEVTALLDNREALKAERSARRSRRHRAGRDTTAQGVLPLDVDERPATDSWRGFQGVASQADPAELPPPASPSSSTAAFPDPVATGSVAGTRSRPELESEASRAESSSSVSRQLGKEQLLAVESEDIWSFGELPTDTPASRSAAGIGADEPEVGRRRMGNLFRAWQGLADVAGGVVKVGRRLKWFASGRRGPLVLGLVALLSITGVGYRACTQIVQAQLDEAARSLALAQGDSLKRAVELLNEHVGSEHSAERERLDFARALLDLDYGLAAKALDYEVEDAFTVFGASASALNQVAEGNLPLARPLGEEAVDRFGDEWLAHWTRGRVAAAEQDWERAKLGFERAHELDAAAVLPILSLVDVALRAGRDAEVEARLAQLEVVSPEHPSLAVVRAALAFGLDPLHSRAGNLQASLPDPRFTTLSLRTRELITVLRARQGLSAWQLDQVGRAIQSLREGYAAPLGVRASLLDALLAARRYRLEEATAGLEQALNAAPPDSPSASVVREVAAVIFADLGRPDLALELDGMESLSPALRARLLVEAGRESDALRLLGRLLDRPEASLAAGRILVDFHLRRGAPERSHLRAQGISERADRDYATARLAFEELDWESARDHADAALQRRPADLDSLTIWSRATAELGLAERGIERIDEHSARSVLVGAFDRARLQVLLTSGRAPRETLADFVGLMESTSPTSMTRLTTLAEAYEAIGDLEKARGAGEQVIAAEPNNRTVHALLGRVYHARGDAVASRRHLQAYLELAARNEPTDWAREILARIDES